MSKTETTKKKPNKNPLLRKWICSHFRNTEIGGKTYTVEIECVSIKEADEIMDFLVEVRDAK